MGGNSIVNSRRVSKEEYYMLWLEIKQELDKNPYNLKSMLVKSYRDKKDHGDIDIIVESIPYWNWINHIQYCFKPEHFYNNKKNFSFSYKGVQIDLIFADPDLLDMHDFFYSYNDLGLILGKMCYGIGCTLGYDGLRKKIYSKDGQKLGEYLITKKPNEICKFLGIEYRTYLNGFNTMEDVFKYATSSIFFTKRYFDPINWTYKQKTRDLKRKNLEMFISNIDKYPEKSYLKNYGKEAYKYRLKEISVDQFYDYLDYWSKLNSEYTDEKIASQILNGNILSEKYGWEKRQLGEAIRLFKSMFKTKKDRINHIKKQGNKVYSFFDCLDLSSVEP